MSGAGRWRPPRPHEPWAGVRSAVKPGPVAPQHPGLVSRLLGGGAEAQAEDCLFLDVFTPDTRGRRPVLVWVHGGAFTTGCGSLPVYDGGRLARRGDVVVVSLNYRLGALGFLCLPELGREPGGAPGNFGLLDQLAALAWVRENAEAFGGDASRVTLFGQSAGAMCAATLLGAPAARGLFHRAVLQSGAARNVHGPEVAERVAATFLDELGVRRGDLGALRARPLLDVLAAQSRTAERLRRELPDPPFQPAVDGALLPRAPLEAVAEGAAADVPLLVGSNRDEWKFYGLSDPGARRLDEDALLRRLRRGLEAGDESRAGLAERVLEAYRSARSGRSSLHPRELWFAIQSDRWFRHPAMRLAEAQAKHQPRTWAYLFTWPSPVMSGALGSCHALEVPFVFGSTGLPPLRALVGEGAAVQRLSGLMQDAWLAFARGEAPGATDLPDWPAYDASRRATQLLGGRCLVVEAPGEAERRVWDEIS